VVQGASGQTAVRTGRTSARQGRRTAAGGHVPEGEAATAQVQDADEAADEADGERSGSLRVSPGARRRPRHGRGVVQGWRAAQTRSADARYNFRNKFFKQICHPENCLHDLLPPKRDPSVSLRLRRPTVYPIPQVRTNRYCSFINYALKKYQ